MPEFSIYLIILDILQAFEHFSGIKYGKVLNMPWYSSYSYIIIIVTNVILIEFLSDRFIYLYAL